MNVEFTAEQIERLSEIAAHAGTDLERLVKDAALSMIEEDTIFRDAVKRGIAEADRGELIEHDEVVARIESRLSRP